MNTSSQTADEPSLDDLTAAAMALLVAFSAAEAILAFLMFS